MLSEIYLASGLRPEKLLAKRARDFFRLPIMLTSTIKPNGFGQLKTLAAWRTFEMTAELEESTAQWKIKRYQRRPEG